MPPDSSTVAGRRTATPLELVGWLFLGTVINYLDRVNIAVITPQLTAHTGWSRENLGWVFSAFLCGYALMQIPGGWLSDRWNPRRLLAAAFIGFSLFTLLTPLGAASLPLMIAVRFIVGAFEAVTFPAMTAFNARTQAPTHVGRAQSQATAGVMVGQIVAFGLTAWVLSFAEWPAVFVLNAALGFLWVALWWVRSRDTQPPRLRSRGDAAPRAAVLEVLRHPSLLLVSACYMGMTYVIWLIIFWTPTYLAEARGFTPASTASAGISMQLAGLIGLLGAGALGDRYCSGRPARRAKLSALLLLLAAPCLWGTVHSATSVMSVACLVAWDALFYGAFAGFAALAIDFSRERAGTVFGTMNALGSGAAILGPVTAGYMTRGGDWSLAFHVCAFVALVAGSLLLCTRIRPLA